MNFRSFDLNLLRVLDALLVEQSTVRAGVRIGLSQSAVSSALGRLRAALGDPLFVRQGQGLVPTDYAQSLELPLRALLDEAESILSGPRRFDPGTAQQSFKISGTDFFAEMLMPALADMLARRAPLVQVRLVDLVRDDYVRTLENADIDLALIPRMDFPSWIDFCEAFRSSFVVVARVGQPRLAEAGIAPGQVVPIELFCDLGHAVFSPEGKPRGMGDLALARIGRERRVVMTMPVFSGILSAVAQSDLVALVPRQIAAHLAPRLGLALYAAPMETPEATLCMAWHKRSSGNPAHRWLRDTVAEALAPLQG